MSSRAKKVMSLVVNYSENPECSSCSENNYEEPPGHNVTTVAEMHDITKRVPSKRLLLGSSQPAVFCDKYPNDKREDMEMESLFGDISDTDDPTYQPSSRRPMSSEDDLITPQDILGDDLQPNNWVNNIILEDDIIEMLREENSQKNETIEISKSILEQILNKMWKNVKPLKRWRKPNRNSWAVNVAKKRRSDGLPYKCRNKDRPAKVPQPVHCQKCKFKCCTIDENAREEICRHYWNLDFVGRKNFILSNICVESPKRVLAVKNKRKQRSFSKKCYLTYNNKRMQVCQKFFTKTLNIGPSVISDAIQKRNSTGTFNIDDKRGKHEPYNKTEPEVLMGIREHIESFPRMDAHYTRKDTNRQFLGPDLNIRKMYSLYEELCQERNQKMASEITYRRIFSTKKKITKEPYKTKEFKFHEFYDLKDLTSKIIHNKDKDNEGKKVHWLKLKRMRFVKGERKIYFNYNMSKNFNYIDVSGVEESKTRSTRSMSQKKDYEEWPTELKRNYEESLPISQAKKKDLMNLIKKNVIPEELESWFTNLKTVNDTEEVEGGGLSSDEN